MQQPCTKVTAYEIIRCQLGSFSLNELFHFPHFNQANDDDDDDDDGFTNLRDGIKTLPTEALLLYRLWPALTHMRKRIFESKKELSQITYPNLKYFNLRATYLELRLNDFINFNENQTSSNSQDYITKRTLKHFSCINYANNIFLNIN